MQHRRGLRTALTSLLVIVLVCSAGPIRTCIRLRLRLCVCVCVRVVRVWRLNQRGHEVGIASGRAGLARGRGHISSSRWRGLRLCWRRQLGGRGLCWLVAVRVLVCALCMPRLSRLGHPATYSSKR